MNKNLLNDLKTIREKYNFTTLDGIIQRLAQQIIQAECPHLEPKTQTGSCFYGAYETTICRTCGKQLAHVRHW